MSVTDYHLEELEIYEELEKLRQEYNDPTVDLMFHKARVIEKTLKGAERILRRAKKRWRIYK